MESIRLYLRFVSNLMGQGAYGGDALRMAFLNGIITTYPIHYFHSDGCTITGPADAAPGQDCVVIVNPSEGYTFKGSSGVRIQDSSGANVPFIVSGNRVSFTYPQPI